MLGCQDFCGYYDWTFAHVRARFGQQAVKDLWSVAIGGDSQQHYLLAGQRAGLRGLYQTWTRTGQDEHCDWTFTLDEQRNVLRWDMRQCPSKGFLLNNDLNADEDYCDHCMGWMIPLLERLGVEVAAHEHNHCGQCWGEMRIKGKLYQPLELPIDIRKDPRWRRGYVDRFAANQKLAAIEAVSSSSDPAEALLQLFQRFDRLHVVNQPSDIGRLPEDRTDRDGVLMSGVAYASATTASIDPLAVVIDSPPAQIESIAHRYAGTDASRRPLLLYAYLPAAIDFDFMSHGLPRPAPILPLLIRQGVYHHRPGWAAPSTEALLELLAAAVQMKGTTAGR